VGDLYEVRRPVSSWIHDAPTDAQVRDDVVAALDDPRVIEAFRLLRAVTNGVPFATAIAAVFYKWDGLARTAKVDVLAEMMGWNMEWLTEDALIENVAAWETPWDDFQDSAQRRADAQAVDNPPPAGAR
jgi:hypothetical protein